MGTRKKRGSLVLGPAGWFQNAASLEAMVAEALLSLLLLLLLQWDNRWRLEGRWQMGCCGIKP
jgi:hypothetical protein